MPDLWYYRKRTFPIGDFSWRVFVVRLCLDWMRFWSRVSTKHQLCSRHDPLKQGFKQIFENSFRTKSWFYRTSTSHKFTGNIHTFLYNALTPETDMKNPTKNGPDETSYMLWVNTILFKFLILQYVERKIPKQKPWFSRTAKTILGQLQVTQDYLWISRFSTHMNPVYLLIKVWCSVKMQLIY